jgi:hypothetical protein
MTTGDVKKTISFPPRQLGKQTPITCLCPEWMCWMPWLSDGEEAKTASWQPLQKNETGHHGRADLNK